MKNFRSSNLPFRSVDASRKIRARGNLAKATTKGGIAIPLPKESGAMVESSIRCIGARMHGASFDDFEESGHTRVLHSAVGEGTGYRLSTVAETSRKELPAWGKDR